LLVAGDVTIPLVFEPGAALVAFTALAAPWLAFETVMRVLQRSRLRAPVSFDPTYVVLVPCLGGSAVVAALLGRRGGLPWPGGPVWPVVVGLTLMAAGIALRVWAILVLGRFFQYRITVQPGHRIVTGGPYRYVRHPSYTGIALVLLGIALLGDDVWALPAVAVLVSIGLAVRIRAEERQLDEALGADYERFATGRKRLVPGVW
jgi:protein-S-isoprenylcysteine O-methyltransferase Ste14